MRACKVTGFDKLQELTMKDEGVKLSELIGDTEDQERKAYLIPK